MTNFELLITVLQEDNKEVMCTGPLEVLTFQQIVKVIYQISTLKTSDSVPLSVKVKNGDINYFEVAIKLEDRTVNVNVIDKGRMFAASEL